MGKQAYPFRGGSLTQLGNATRLFGGGGARYGFIIFQLLDFEKSQEYFQKYLTSHCDSQTNQYSFDNETITKVYDAWKFTIDRWQYTPLQ